MATQKYDNLRIEIDPGEGQDYPVSFQSDAGADRGTMHFPYTPEELEAQLRQISVFLREPHEVRAREYLEGFGTRLMQALFFDKLSTNFRRCLERAVPRGKGVRLRLVVYPPYLASVPWEFLFDKERRQFLALDRNTPIVRDPPIDITPHDLKVDVGEVRVLAMYATPKGFQSLDVEAEKGQITSALAKRLGRGKFALKWADGQTVEVLQRHLQEEDYHVFHFIGHGGYRPESGESEVELSNAAGGGHPLTTTQLRDLLGGHNSLRLVVLNACLGAAGSEGELFSSVAAGLVLRGIPSVIGMRFELLDSTAIHFATGFYGALVRGLPVDKAVVEGRLAIQQQTANNFEWALPVHYLRSPDGDLLPEPGRRPGPLWLAAVALLVAIALLGILKVWPPLPAIPAPESIGFRQSTITALGIDFPRSVDNLWVAVEKQGVYFNRLESSPLLANKYVSAILPRSDSDSCVGQEVFFGTLEGGLWVYSPQEKRLTHYGEAEGLSSSDVTALFCAGPDELWIGTVVGLDRLLLDKQRWEYFDLDQLEWRDEKPATDYYVRDLALNPRTGKIWAITRDSLFQPGDPQQILHLQGTVNPIPMEAYDLTALCFTGDGRPVLSSGSGQTLTKPTGLEMQNPDDDGWRDISFDTGSKPRINDLACLPQGRIIAATRNGVWVYDPASGQWVTHLPDTEFYTTLARNGLVLLASSNGVYRIVFP